MEVKGAIVSLNEEAGELEPTEELYYLSSIVFSENNEQENAAACLKWTENPDELSKRYANQYRNSGFNFKRNNDIHSSIEAFSRGADAGDPVSQYELANLLGKRHLRYEPLLNQSASRLIHSQVALYKFYREGQLYEKANTFLLSVMQSTRRVGLRMSELPLAQNEEFIIDPNGYYPKYQRNFDSATDKWTEYKLRNLHDVLYEEALNKEDSQERIDFYNLAALNGNAKALVNLHELSAQQK